MSILAHSCKLPKGSNVEAENVPQSFCNFETNILNGSSINFAYLCTVICASKESCVNWLRTMGFISSIMHCIVCGSEMMWKKSPRLTDGVIWSCIKTKGKKVCSKRRSVRVGSWFEAANMTFEQILFFCYMWINKFSEEQILLCGISTSNYVAWTKYFTRICKESVAGVIEPSSSTSSGKQVDSAYEHPLTKWTKINSGQDTFIKFLKDASQIYQKDAKKILPVTSVG